MNKDKIPTLGWENKQLYLEAFVAATPIVNQWAPILSYT